MSRGSLLCESAREFLSKSQDSFLIQPGSISNERLQVLASRIASVDPNRLNPIGVLIPQDPDGYLIMLSAIASGRPVVPLSRSADSSLLRSRLESVGADLIVCLEEDRVAAGTLASVVLCPDESLRDSIDPLPECDSNDPVFFCFTSGTSGAPRPFARTQLGMALLGEARGRLFEHSQETRMIFCSSILFVGFVNNLAAQIVGGFRFHFDDISSGIERIVQTIVDNRIDFVSLVPTVVKTLVTSSARDALMRMDRTLIINLSGEPYTREDIRQWSYVFRGKIRFANTYGSTESGTVLGAILSDEDLIGDEPVETGTPVDGVEVLLVDEDGAVIEGPGTAGAVHVRSAMVSKNLDVEHDPFISIDGHGSNWFPMGDMARRSESGRYSVLGRFDGVMKFNGLRLDAPAIESSLRRLDFIDDVAIFSCHHGSSAFPAALIDGDRNRLSDVISELRTLTPLAAKFEFTFVDRIPVLPNGKRDRRSFQSIFETGDSPAGVTVDSTCSDEGTLALLADVWSSVLAGERPREDDSFVFLGGDSLALVSVLVSLRENYGLECDVTMVHEGMTLAEMANCITPAIGEQPVVMNLVSKPDASEAMILFPGVGGHPWAFQPLMSALETDRETFAVDWNRQVSFSDVRQDLSVRLGGRPVCVVGFSMGVPIAIQQMRSLARMGVQVTSFLGIDGPCAPPVIERVKYLLRSRRARRRAGDLHGVARYLALHSSEGWWKSAVCRTPRIEVPCGVISTHVAARSLVERTWRRRCRGRFEIRFLDCAHLELVRSPIPRSLIEAVRSFQII